jgi:hypothetical protein
VRGKCRGGPLPRQDRGLGNRDGYDLGNGLPVPEDEDLFAALYRGEKGGGVPAELGECHLFHGNETTLYIIVHFTPPNVKGGSDAQLEDGRARRIFLKFGAGLGMILGIDLISHLIYIRYI